MIPRLLVLLILLVGTADSVSAHPPAAAPAEIFASGIAGPEGLAFTRDGKLVVGTITGDILLFEDDGTSTVLANVGERLAGLTLLRDGRVLAASFGTGRVWAVTRAGAASVFASGVPGVNFVVETRRNRRIFASASLAGQILDITTGTPVVAASGLTFPNGLALARLHGRRFLYVAESLGGGGKISRMPLDDADVLGPLELLASGVFPLADGIALDGEGNVLVVNADTFKVILADTGEVQTLSADPLLDWPSNLAFGRRRFGRRTIYLPNYGPGFGDGTTVVRLEYNHRGARLSR